MKQPTKPGLYIARHKSNLAEELIQVKKDKQLNELRAYGVDFESSVPLCDIYEWVQEVEKLKRNNQQSRATTG